MVLFSTFWLLFISSFVGTKIDSDDEAKIIYSNVMIVSVVFGLVLMPFLGKIVDIVNPQIVIPLAFFVRMTGIVFFLFIKDPSSIYSYSVSVVLVLGTSFETLATDCLLLRNAEPRVRGLVFGTGHAFGSLGILLFSLVGGILFDRYGPYVPFMLVGACDASFCFVSIILSLCGVIKNDIKEKKI